MYQVQRILNDVRVAIDQNKTSEQLIADQDIDTLSLEEIVRSKIVEAVRRVETEAPVYLLEEGHDFSCDADGQDTAIYWDKLESGWVMLPDDFMRLVAFKMSDWERTVYQAISVADPLYEKQSSRYKGIRGNTQKPVCAIANHGGGKALEFYSCNSEDAYIARASYIPYPEIDEEDGIDISERCYEAVIYTAASLVLITLGEADKASALSDLAKSLLQL